MKANRFWIELITLCTAIACALALLFATLGAAAGAATAEPEPSQASELAPTQQHTYEGMVTCTRCGAKHKATIGKTATDCTLACVQGGAQFALVDGDKTYILLGDIVVLKRIAGQRVEVTGALHGNAIKVTSVSAQK
jgi:hypothetical protein